MNKWYVLYDENDQIIMKTQNPAIHQGLKEIEAEPETGWDGRLYPKGKTPVKPAYLAAKDEIRSLKADLSALDYKQFKYLRGELSDAEWDALKTEIKSKVDRINRLENI